MNNKKVLMAMSGGIDSTISAIMLKELGYDVIGVTMKTWDYADEVASNKKETGCCNLESFNDAREAAVKFGFPHYVLDLRDEFSNAVVNDFVNSYMSGKTPNPCIQCNTFIKWNALLKKADALGCNYIATGHYAKISYNDNRYYISKALDNNKDQSYVLWGLSQEVLKRTLFPLHNYTKPMVRQFAKDYGLEDLSKKKESYEICFIPNNDYRSFLRKKVPNFEEKTVGGIFKNKEGDIIGTQEGFPFFTIGQRKKLGKSFGKKMFVTDINANDNIVTLGEENELLHNTISLRKVNLMKYKNISEPTTLTTKIRYRDSGTLSIVKQNKQGKYEILFPNNVKAPTPGQSAVFYENNDVVGGGFISTIHSHV